MVALLLRAAPWRAVTGVSAVAAVLGATGVAFPAAGPTFIGLAFALLAAAAAFAVDERASPVVDVTPTRLSTRTAIRGVLLLVPLGTGAALTGAGALRTLALPWLAVGVALAGQVLLGFAAACVARPRMGEPGVLAGTAVMILLVVPDLLPSVPQWLHTFPASAAQAPAAQVVWLCVLAACVLAIAATCSGRLRRAA